MQRFIEKFGSLLLSVVIAIGTIGYFKANTESNIVRLNEKAAEQRENQKAMEQRLSEAEKNGTPFARTATQHNAEKIASLEAKADKVLDMVGNMNTTQAEMRRDLAYLVRVCGDKENTHAKVSLHLGDTSLAESR